MENVYGENTENKIEAQRGKQERYKENLRSTNKKFIYIHRYFFDSHIKK